jgi:SAM-dependent methyltransferase
MAGPSFARRAEGLELLDAGSHDERELQSSLAEMARVNRWLGGNRAIRRHLGDCARSVAADEPLAVLDVGTGRGDLPLFIARALGRRPEVKVYGLDLQRQIVRIAHDACRNSPGVEMLAGDALALPFETDAVDVVVSSLTLHHFDDEAAAAVVAEMARVAKRRVIITDLERHPMNYAGAQMLASTLWRRDPYSRNDGPLSVLRAFTRDELARIGRSAGLVRVQVFRHFPYRLALVGRISNGRTP